MKTTIILTKEFLQHITEAVNAMPGNNVVIKTKDNELKVFVQDEQQNEILAIYKPNQTITYAPVSNSNAAANGSSDHHNY